MPARPHLLTSIFTHLDHVLRGLSFFLVLGIWKCVIYLIQDVANCTWPDHFSPWQWRTEVMSSMSSFCSNEAEYVSSLSLMPQIQWIMAQSLQWSCCSSGSSGVHIPLPWSTAEATYTLPHIMGEKCLNVRRGKSCHSPLWSTAYHQGSRKWLQHHAWCPRHPLNHSSAID